jgi:tripartite ATP-independent transporter DctM subunit
MITGLDSFPLLAIPFFVLAGQIMNRGGLALRLVNFAKVIVGIFPGGLAFVNIVGNMLFGAISGSAAATATAIGGFMGPAMEKEGYDKNFGAAVNVTSATTGLLIPPSNVLIVFSLVSGGVSIAGLFLAGYLPGILMGVGLMLVAFIWAKRKGYKSEAFPGMKQFFIYLWHAIPSFLLLVIVMGGIIGGIFSATEASAIAVVYALVVGLLYKEIKMPDLKKILLDSVKPIGIIMILVSISIGMGWVMAFEDIPQSLSNFMLGLTDNKILILLMINVLLLLVGIFMDITPAVLIFTPIFLPVVTELGIEPIHFGIMLVANLSIGLCTPPIGTILFVGCSVANTSIQKILKPILPLYVVMIIMLMAIVYIPALSLWLPSVFGF